jgi:signal transduction histidine kinase/CheY-like chemotaxis protein
MLEQRRFDPRPVMSQGTLPGERSAGASTQQPVLLLVDDEPMGLRALASLFGEDEYELWEASSGQAAIDLIEKIKPDLVLLDVMMPGVDGFEVCRRIRTIQGVAEIPILLVTALDERESRLRGLEAGADDYISKPFDRAEVRARVRTIARLNRYRKLQEEIILTQQAMSELRENTARQEGLRRIDKAILSATTSREIAASVLPLLRDLISHEHAAAYEYDLRTQTMVLLAELGAGLPLTSGLQRLGLKELGIDFQRGREEYLPAVLPLPKQTEISGVLAAMRSAGAISVLAVPLSLKGRLFGLLLLGSSSPVAFASPTVELAQEVGDILALALAHAELLDRVTRGRTQLEFLSRRLLQVREEESRHVARELHDEIGQLLAVLNISLRGIQQTVSGDAINEPLEYCLELVGRLLTKVRGLSLDLHPALLEDFGLMAALRRHIDSVLNRTWVAVSLEADDSLGRFDRELETVCYRVIQEALTNAIRHGKASKVRVELTQTPGRLELLVQDDGRGFDPEAAMEHAAAGASLGLLGMRERVSLVGGELSVLSTPGEGARIRASFPLNQQPARATVPQP